MTISHTKDKTKTIVAIIQMSHIIAQIKFLTVFMLVTMERIELPTIAIPLSYIVICLNILAALVGAF